MSKAANDVLRERTRQQVEKGHTVAKDDNYDLGELSGAGAAYALHAASELHPLGNAFDAGDVPPGWCWDESTFKPKSPRQNLVIAAALIIAEIEKIDRLDT